MHKQNDSISSTRKLVDLASAVCHVQTKVPSIVTFGFLGTHQKPQTCSMKNSFNNASLSAFFFQGLLVKMLSVKT